MTDESQTAALRACAEARACDCGSDREQSARFGHSHLPWCASLKGRAEACPSTDKREEGLLDAIIEQAKTWRATGDHYTAIQYEDAAHQLEAIARRFGASVTIWGEVDLPALPRAEALAPHPHKELEHEDDVSR